MDESPKIILPVVLDANNKPYCKKDLSDITSGSHTVTATFIARNDIWGDIESVKSVPFTFDRPISQFELTIPITIRIIH